MTHPIYALNLFNISNRDEYMAYSRRSTQEVQAHGGRVVALGKFLEVAVGDMAPRTVLILVEWANKAAFDSYSNDPALVDLHPHRINGTSNVTIRNTVNSGAGGILAVAGNFTGTVVTSEAAMNAAANADVNIATP